MQALSMKVFGINEFAIRFPSAISSLLTVLLVYFFSIRNLQSKTIGIISSIILVSSKGFISQHVARSGNLDATLVFWLTLGLFTFIDLIINKPSRTHIHYILLSISIIFGFLTKGIAGFFFIPFMFIISCCSRNRFIFKDSKLYIATALIFLSCISYYIIRELLAAGYLEVVLKNEILRYSNNVMNWHVHPFDLYYQNIKDNYFNAFFYFLPLALTTLFIAKQNRRLVTIYLFIVAIGYFPLISYPDVKLVWYDAPLYPLFAILISLGFIEMANFITRKLPSTRIQRSVYSLLLISSIIYLYFPYKDVIKSAEYDDKQIYSMEFDGAYLRYLRENNIDIKQLNVLKKEVDIEHYDQVLFYIRAYNIEDELQIQLKHQVEFENGDLVMCTQEPLKTELLEKYTVNVVNSWKEGALYKITATL